MTYSAVVKLFKALLRFDIVEYYIGSEGCLNRLEMALNEVFDLCYIIDIQCIDEYGELGSQVAKTMINYLPFCPL